MIRGADKDFRLFEKLVLDDKERAPELLWYSSSREDPKAFFEEIFSHHNQRGIRASKSRPFLDYDVYHDLIYRNTQVGRKAYAEHHSQLGWQITEFGQLDVLVRDRCRVWLQQELEPGQSLVVLRKLSLDCLVDTLAGLRLGLMVTVLQTSGRMYLQRRCDELKPDFLSMDTGFDRWFPKFKDAILPTEGVIDETRRIGSHVYKADDVVLRLYPYSSRLESGAREITAHELMRTFMRDTSIGLTLGVGDNLLDVELPFVHYQPLLFLTCLYAGACYTRLTETQIRMNPGLINDQENTLCIVRARFRKFLAKQEPRNLSNWRLWLRDPTESLDWELWQEFMKAFKLTKTPTANLIYDSGAGGAVMFSIRRTKAVHFQVMPAAGEGWYITDLPPTGKPTLSTYGAYAFTDGDEFRLIGTILLSEYYHEWLYVGTFEPRRCFQAYPSHEVLLCLEGLPWLKQCSAVSQMGTQEAVPHVFSILLFIGDVDPDLFEAQRSQWLEEAQQAVALEMGSHCLPDRWEFVPLIAQRLGGVVNHKWVEAQFRSGAIKQKVELPIFRDFARLKQNILPGLRPETNELES